MKIHRIHPALILATAVFLIVRAALAGGPPAGEKHDFAKAQVMDRVLLAVMEHYYDPQRIDVERMFQATMDALQKGIAEAKVSFDDEKKKAVIDVLGSTMVLDLKNFNSPWDFSRYIRKVFRFLDEKLPHEEYDFGDLEYLAANAMLSTLDPHSNALPPDIYEDLRMDTAGEFGGLGIRITTDRRPPCKGVLTVVDVFEDTPAGRAGLKAGDQILRIEGESTVNITTAEAAHRLRGRPGSTVKIQVRRPDGSTRSFKIRRETIPIESVTWKLLEGKVGYIHLEAFQGNSDVEFGQTLRKLHEKEMKGLILDLRSNPGGLLDVAIKIADKFLDSGTIVATAGRGEDDQIVRNATVEDTEPRYPMVVLINSSSASAAEIIAGALRNHGRALLIGETTFGKGSVQMVQPIPGGGALKLTSAQYLTPGKISIQAVGVPPDVTFIPHTVDKRDLDFGHSGAHFSEADLEGHLDRPSTRTRDDRVGAVEATVFVPVAERRADRERFKRCFIDDEDRYTFQDRYEVELSRRIIAGANGVTAEELLIRAREQIIEDNKNHEQSVRRALKKYGITWTSVPKQDSKKSEVNKEDSRVSATAKVIGEATPGRELKVSVTVKNGSSKTISRLSAVTKSDNYLLNQIDFVFGEVKPGRRKTWSTIVKLPETATARVDEVAVNFKSEDGPIPKPAKFQVEISKRQEPRLAFGWQFEDLGNGNGIVEPGEEITVFVTVKNIGQGMTKDAQADLSAKAGVDVIRGRFDLGKLRPGASVDGNFRLRVSDRFRQKKAELHFTISDWFGGDIPITQTLLRREVDLPVSPPGPGPESASGSVTVQAKGKVILREGPSKNARAVAETQSGASFSVDASTGDFFRVALDGKRHAWILRSETTPGGGPRPKFSLVLVEPPNITLKGKRVLRVKKDKIKVKGIAEHPVRVRDVMVFVGDRKLLYLPNKSGTSGKSLEFEVDVSLKDGVNHVLVVARHDDKVVSVVPIFVRRDASK
ncbi:MAG: PDZ domain-containing protein [Deltaproteobacteria bacterium]|nr:PDZ domain-containing protein [Deltaproteobacteria bacterium]